jgi:putative hydrolase of the HAD superfamily
MKCKAVIFDLFGTLVEDFTFSVNATNTDLAKALGAPHEPFAQMWRKTSDMRVNGTFQTVEAAILHVCDAIGVQVGPERIKKAVKIRLQQIRDALKPKAHAVATLTQLRNYGFETGVLSNCSIEIPILWQKTEFAALFDSTVFSSRECLKKPDPTIFRLACERLGVAPEACFYVADGENYELATAARVGMQPVLIRNQLAQHRSKLFLEAEEWKGAAVHDLSEIVATLNRLSPIKA